MHNYYRGVIASGWAADPKSVYAPRASKMTALKYECATYAKDAADKVKTCTYPVPDPTKGVQNTHKIDNWTITHQEALEQALAAWYGELEASGGIGADPTYADDMKTKLGNYVNLANEANTVVGCAVETCKKEGYTLVACQYDSPLNDGDPIYTPGKTCSKCKETAANKQCETQGAKALCIP
ncbi:SCP-like protein [Ancylostoma caninum]|uniref:SCP-like protein n=1 Tax=Ancylostoma caninum TaxID=29170 RepID=A0A368H790_ANCCA|nr:SCP-like protein [Ancylostoma caninum]